MVVETERGPHAAPDDEEDALLSVPEVARRLGVRQETVRTWLREGRLVGSKLPGSDHHHWRVKRSSLRALGL